MSSFVKTITKAIASGHLFAEGERVVVACSGGADSIALLHVLVSLPSPKLHLVVAHLDHGLRGVESAADAAFVSRFAAGLGLPCEVGHADVKAIAMTRGLSLEEAGREARYAFFLDVMQRYEATAVALGHHQDDQAETFLMRLLRGAGTLGLSAMKPRDEWKVRPLLDVSRATLRNYLTEMGLAWREDASNADESILRNTIRHTLLPVMEEIGGDVSGRIAQATRLLAADDEALEAEAEARWQVVARHDGHAVRIDVQALLRETRALRYRLIRRAILTSRGTLRGISLTHVEDVDRLCRSEKPNALIHLPGNLSAIREYEFLVLTHRKFPHSFDIIINGAGTYALPDGSCIEITRSDTAGSPADGDSLLFDGDAAPFPWRLRPFIPGDRFVPFGMSGRKKVKDWFIDRKIPMEIRKTMPLLVASDGSILAIGTIGRSNVAPLTTSSRRPVRVRRSPGTL